ncbi:MAG: hypothetical protein C5S45_03290 [Candidatus Methanocomedens sp.]|nr:MAG: hypothetical protein C5S45_03290 [ANME-2 cluster archaeon]
MAVLILMSVHSANAKDINIIDVYSDIDSTDITIHSGEHYTDITLKAELTFKGNVLESKQFHIDEVSSDTDITKIAFWDLTNPKEGFYRTIMTMSMDGSVLETKYSNFSYGWQAMPGVSIKDIVPDSSGISIILAPFYTTKTGTSKPVLTDIEYMLVDGDTVIYRTTDNRVTVVQATPLSKNWNVLLENNHDYSTRVKARISSPEDAVIAQSKDFTSKDDVRITELYRDETGASATVEGYSQVPFDGYVVFTVTKDDTIIEEVREKSPILTTADDETIEIIWTRKLAAGIYGLSVEVIGNDGDILDRWDTVIESDYDSSADATPEHTPTDTPGFDIIPATFVLVLLYLLSGRMDRRGG